MEAKDHIESVVYHQTQCLNTINDLQELIKHGEDSIAINKLKDLQKELTRLTMQLKQIEDEIPA